jgi:hypothetical protein
MNGALSQRFEHVAEHSTEHSTEHGPERSLGTTTRLVVEWIIVRIAHDANLLPEPNCQNPVVETQQWKPNSENSPCIEIVGV